MKVLIAKHYWKDGKNATWECHSKVDTKLFEYLKENYYKFVKSREQKISFGKYKIILCYEDSKDIYNRDITNITFFISKKELDSSICSKNYYNLELKIKDKSNNKNSKYLIVLATIIFIGLLMLFLNTNSNKSQEENNIAINKNINYNTLIDNWNDQIQKIMNNIDLLLPRDNNKRLIEKLNKLIIPYKKPEYQTDSLSYAKYRKQFKIDNNIKFKNGMSSEEIKQLLQKITKEKTYHNIVKHVIKMNSEKFYKKSLKDTK